MSPFRRLINNPAGGIAYVELKHWYPPAGVIGKKGDELAAQLANHAERFGSNTPINYVFRGPYIESWETALQETAEKLNLTINIEFLGLATPLLP